MKLEPKYYVLDELLQRRLFRIPEYQRTYSWVTKQRQDLFNDIIKILQYPSDRHHFMATVVCLNTNEKEQIGVTNLKRQYRRWAAKINDHKIFGSNFRNNRILKKHV